MDLYILRHAIAEEHTTSPADDRQRRLTPDGAKKMCRLAGGMKSLKLSFDVILSSPFLRAGETAKIVAKVFGLEKKLQFTPSLEPGGNPEELIRQLQRAYRKKQNVLIVGHEPYLTRLISLLISGDTRASIELKKGGLCKLSVDALRYGRCATVEWLLPPGLLKEFK